MKSTEYRRDIAGKEITVSINNLAERADASILVSSRNTAVLVTAVVSKETSEKDFFPLTVDFEEKFYASGKILGSKYVRREGKPSDDAVLSGRIIDRTIRPLFDPWIRNEVQIIATVLAVGEADPDMLALLGTSIALGISPVPWNGPAAGVRTIISQEGSVIHNPSFAERENFKAELLVCGHSDLITMIEFAGHEIPEADALSLIEAGKKYIAETELFIKDILKEQKVSKISIPKPEISEELHSYFKTDIGPKLDAAIFTNTPGDERVRELQDVFMNKAAELEQTNAGALFFEETVTRLIQEAVVLKEKRADGRGIHEIRPLFAQAGGISSQLHGTGIFFRGQTHILSVLTLGAPGDAQAIEGDEEYSKRYIHHYNFPPFSTGETGRVGGANRRMIGHGALAEKALLPVLPEKEAFPYTIRVVSEALSSNGSTSMGSVCGSTLALMDAGVPISSPVAGISCGLMHHDGKEVVITDIQGPEDHYGDMDFKVAGTQKGITAIQLDVKVPGISLDIVSEVFKQTKTARTQILEVIQKAIPAPRERISPHAPEIISTKININQIGMVIGPGGKMIKSILEETKASAIDIDDNGLVLITGKNGSAQKALSVIARLTKEFTVGEKFEGTISKIMPFGAFAAFDGGEGLIHVSEFASFRVEKPEDFVKVGMKIPVVIKEIDERKRINLSIKQADPNFFKKPSA